MRRLFGLLISVLILGSLVMWRLAQHRAESTALANQRQARAGAPPPVTTAVAQVDNVENVFTTTGSLESPVSVNISSRITGRIVYLQGHEGDHVRRGQVLVRLDPAEVEAAVRQAQANLSGAQYRLAQAQITEAPTSASVETQIRQAEAAVATARADHEQVRQNYQSQVAAAEASVVEAQARVDATEGSIGSAQAGINSAEANLENARTRYERLYELYTQGYIAAQDVDDAKAAVRVQQAAVEAAREQLRSAKANRASAVAQREAAEHQVEIAKTKGQADIEAAHQKLAQAEAALDYAQANTAQTPAYQQSLAALRAQVDVARASLESAKAQRAYTTLTSPMDGYVTARYLNAGALATVGQPILAVQSFREVWVTFSVPDYISARMRRGQLVAVAFDALPGRDFGAKVIQINPSADPQARQFTIRAVLDNSKSELKPGMFARVTIVTEKVTQVVTVPREAVQEGPSGSYVVVVTPEGTARHRPVSVGLLDAASAEITSGLKAGEAVVTLSAAPIKDGQRVSTDAQESGPGEGGGSSREALPSAAPQSAPGQGGPSRPAAPSTAPSGRRPPSGA